MQITVCANAKINITLDVTGTDERGYHLLDSVFQSVSLCDIISIKTSVEKGIKIFTHDDKLSGTDNTVYKAANLFLDATDVKDGLEITLNKNIPVSAGLGGGSTDAAATLMALNKLYGEPLSNEELKAIALEIGADVPFCLEGGTMRATGVGEILEPLPSLPDCYIVIIKKGNKPSTKEMYSRLDKAKELDRPDNRKFIEALKDNDYKTLCNNMKNVFSCLWDLDGIKQIIASTSPDSVVLSGSGPSVTAFFDNRDRALKAVNLLNAAEIENYLCKPEKKAYRFE